MRRTLLLLAGTFVLVSLVAFSLVRASPLPAPWRSRMAREAWVELVRVRAAPLACAGVVPAYAAEPASDEGFMACVRRRQEGVRESWYDLDRGRVEGLRQVWRLPDAAAVAFGDSLVGVLERRHGESRACPAGRGTTRRWWPAADGRPYSIEVRVDPAREWTSNREVWLERRQPPRECTMGEELGAPGGGLVPMPNRGQWPTGFAIPQP